MFYVHGFLDKKILNTFIKCIVKIYTWHKLNIIIFLNRLYLLLMAQVFSGTSGDARAPLSPPSCARAQNNLLHFVFIAGLE